MKSLKMIMFTKLSLGPPNCNSSSLIRSGNSRKWRRGRGALFQIYVDYCREKATLHGRWTGEIGPGERGRMGELGGEGSIQSPTFPHFDQLSGSCLIDFMTNIGWSK